MELDVGVAALLSLVVVQLSLASVYLSVQSSSEMLAYADAQLERIVFSDELINRNGVYDAECRSVLPQTVGEVPANARFNVSLRRLGEPSNATGVVVRRLVFVREEVEENERVLEVW
jgi:hypothetical protein